MEVHKQSNLMKLLKVNSGSYQESFPWFALTGEKMGMKWPLSRLFYLHFSEARPEWQHFMHILVCCEQFFYNLSWKQAHYTKKDGKPFCPAILRNNS